MLKGSGWPAWPQKGQVSLRGLQAASTQTLRIRLFGSGLTVRFLPVIVDKWPTWTQLADVDPASPDFFKSLVCVCLVCESSRMQLTMPGDPPRPAIEDLGGQENLLRSCLGTPRFCPRGHAGTPEGPRGSQGLCVHVFTRGCRCPSSL